MNLLIENNRITIQTKDNTVSGHINNVSFLHAKMAQSITLYISSGEKYSEYISQTTVNGVQMTPDNIDELLSPIFNSTGGSGGGISLPIDIKDVDGLQKILDDISESITLEDAVSGVRSDTIQLWNNAISALEATIYEKYTNLRSNPFILASNKTTLDTQAKSLQDSFTSLKSKLTQALSAEIITDDAYNSIKSQYTSVINLLTPYKKKEYEIEQNTLANQSANPSAANGTLTKGGKVDVYPWIYTARLSKNTTDNFMTLSIASRSQTRKTFLQISRNGVLTKQQIDINTNFTTLFTDLGKDGSDMVIIFAFDQLGLRSFTIDLSVAYSTDPSDTDIYSIASKYINL